MRRAACHVAIGDFGVARADYEKVAEIDPDCEQARAGIARCTAPRAGVGGGPGRASAVIAEKFAEIDPYEVLGIERDATAAQVEPIIILVILMMMVMTMMISYSHALMMRTP